MGTLQRTWNDRPVTLALGAVIALSLSLTASMALAQEEVPAPSIYTTINLSRPVETDDLVVPVRSVHSRAYGWKAGDRVAVRVFVLSANGERRAVTDEDGRDVWIVKLDKNAEAVLVIRPSSRAPSGRLMLMGNGKELFEPRPGGLPDRILEKVYEERFEDGAGVRVHFTESSLESAGETLDFAKEVLAAAAFAYRTITTTRGFSSEGYSFARPDASYAYDPDRTIDVHLGGPEGGLFLSNGTADALAYKDAPCFDTIRAGDKAFHAVILLPANYKEFIRGWEKINPSSLGQRRAEVDLRGTLIHEMLHAIVFYYNKNLNREAAGEPSAVQGKRRIDWYVEGLARYFETFAGARHDFYSHGFKQLLPDKVRFSRGGSNYFMRYPDQSFTELRYENALFWRFIDYRYGMDRIERLSREFRGTYGSDFKEALERVTGLQFAELLRQFSLAILFKDFGLGAQDVNLREIATTRLLLKEGQLYLEDGYGATRALGTVCQTDWIGLWDEARAALGEPSVAGDSSDRSDVSPWATDFVRLRIDGTEGGLPVLGIGHLEGGSHLTVQAALRFRDGSVVLREVRGIAPGGQGRLDLQEIVASEGLTAGELEQAHLLITNTDDQRPSTYDLRLLTA